MTKTLDTHFTNNILSGPKLSGPTQEELKEAPYNYHAVKDAFEVTSDKSMTLRIGKLNEALDTSEKK